jgi:hypothetical protein
LSIIHGSFVLLPLLAADVLMCCGSSSWQW